MVARGISEDQAVDARSLACHVATPFVATPKYALPSPPTISPAASRGFVQPPALPYSAPAESVPRATRSTMSLQSPEASTPRDTRSPLANVRGHQPLTSPTRSRRRSPRSPGPTPLPRVISVLPLCPGDSMGSVTPGDHSGHKQLHQSSVGTPIISPLLASAIAPEPTFTAPPALEVQLVTQAAVYEREPMQITPATPTLPTNASASSSDRAKSWLKLRLKESLLDPDGTCEETNRGFDGFNVLFYGTENVGE